MSLGFILLIVLVLFLIGALPRWPHSANWGYYPSGGMGIVLVVVLVLLLTGRTLVRSITIDRRHGIPPSPHRHRRTYAPDLGKSERLLPFRDGPRNPNHR